MKAAARAAAKTPPAAAPEEGGSFLRFSRPHRGAGALRLVAVELGDLEDLVLDGGEGRGHGRAEVHGEVEEDGREDDEVAAVATWEPMLSEIVNNTSRTGSSILVSSADFNGLITDVVIVNKQDYAAHRAKYETLMRGIYRAVDLYNSDPDKFLAVASPVYDVTPDVMAGDLGGVYYTSYEDALDYFGVGGRTAKLGGVIDSLNEINVDLDLMDAAIDFGVMVDPTLSEGLFDGHTR